MNPIERPPYASTAHPLGVAISVEAKDWRALLLAAALALSDVLRPLGQFGTWTARRISARGETPAATLSAWLSRVLDDHRESGFSTAIVEVEKALATHAAGILRGGCVDPAESPPAFGGVAVPAAEVFVAEGKGGAAWTARFVLHGAPEREAPAPRERPGRAG